MSGVRIAQVGCGYWGKNLARNFAEIGVLAAVVDDDFDTAARFAALHGASAMLFAQVLADPTIDGVSLATPAGTHAAMAVQALEAGKHVFVEKPLALHPDDARRVIGSADARRRVLMVGHLLQYHPTFRKLRSLVESGEIGKVRYIYSNRLSLGKYRTEENVLWSFAPHDISMILALIGEEPQEVEARGASFVTAGIADWVIATMTFPSGVVGHVQASWSHPFKEHRLVVVGDDAMAVFEDSNPAWDKRLALYRHRIARESGHPVPIKADAEYVEVPSDEPLKSECLHFIACIEGGVQPFTDGREGLAVLNVLDRAEASLAASLQGPPQ